MLNVIIGMTNCLYYYLNMYSTHCGLIVAVVYIVYGKFYFQLEQVLVTIEYDLPYMLRYVTHASIMLTKTTNYNKEQHTNSKTT